MKQHFTALLFGVGVLLSAATTSVQAQQTFSQHNEIELQLVAENLTAPVYLTYAPDDSGRLFVVDQAGAIYIVTPDGTMLEEPFLDLQDSIVDFRDNFDERGLLGLAFHPEYAENGRFFVYYSAPLRDEGPEGWDHTSHVSEFAVSEDADVADPESEQIIIQIDQPQFNHNGGTVVFGPTDGYLYISLGDGGGAGDVDEGHTPQAGNAQDFSNLLGSILRIDIDGDAPYAIPGDNPLVGVNSGLDEIYAYGLRNPYRMSFDRGGTNELFAADAGQDLWEEVNIIVSGGNYGWNIREGTHCFDPEDFENPPDDCPEVCALGQPLRNPVIEYPHIRQADSLDNAFGTVVVGGHMYRGSAIPELEGHYVFGDWSRDFGAPDGTLLVAAPQEEGLWPVEQLMVRNDDENGRPGHYVLGFGEDHEGELYVLTTDNTAPTGSTGRVYRLVPIVEVATEADVPGASHALELRAAHPNPFMDQASLSLSVSHAQHVAVEVFDALGRRVAVLHDGVVLQGSSSFTFDADGLPAGVYVVRASGEESAATRTVTLVR